MPGASPVGAAQRFNVRRGRACPGCGGGADLPPHQGRRCYGFTHGDPRWFTCTRLESPWPSAEGWAHFRGEGDCRCGADHGIAPQLPSPVAVAHARPNDSERVEWALQIWRNGRDPRGTPAETYVRRRAITDELPPSLRFAVLPHKPSGRTLPALVAAVTDVEGNVRAVHRTYLAPGGRGKAPVEPAKMMLGPTGGLSVHLAPAAERIAVAEGIETALSVQQVTGLPTWAALSAGGIQRLELPPLTTSILIAADGDRDGRRAARIAGQRWRAEGRQVQIVVPRRSDFNDSLAAGAA